MQAAVLYHLIKDAVQIDRLQLNEEGREEVELHVQRLANAMLKEVRTLRNDIAALHELRERAQRARDRARSASPSPQ